jgi:CRISPR-associated protein Csm3
VEAELGRWDVLRRRGVVRGLLVARTGLHVGAGAEGVDPVAPDDAVVRDARRHPLIPGSSLKGALRAYLERLVNGGWLGALPDPPCWHVLAAQDRASEWDTWVQRDAAYELGKILRRLCPVCRLFGVPHYGGRLLIRDLPLVRTPGVREVMERTGVGIDRDTGTARSGILYDFEVVPAGSAFALEWVLENPSDEDWRVTVLGLLALARGDVHLGGKVSRGLGSVGLEEVQIWDLRGEDGSLRRWLFAQTLEAMPALDLEDARERWGGEAGVV